MKTVRGIVLPDSDTHFGPMIEAGPLFEGKGTYQKNKLDRAMPFVKQFRGAVDVGCHVGLWARVLQARFQCVTAFEPVQELYDCAQLNLEGSRFIRLMGCALGTEESMIQMSAVADNTGNARVDSAGDLSVPVRRLDWFKIKDVDFIKIDVEGFEYFVLQGAEETIRQWKPTIVVEQKPTHGSKYGLDDTAAVTLLESWGYKLEWHIGGDYCLTCQ